jgi:hypothetical protein
VSLKCNNFDLMVRDSLMLALLCSEVRALVHTAKRLIGTLTEIYWGAGQQEQEQVRSNAPLMRSRDLPHISIKAAPAEYND